MRTSSTAITPNQHVEIGNRMKEIRSMLMPLVSLKNIDAALQHDTVKAILALDHLRTKLECLLHTSVPPHRDPRYMRPLVYSGTRCLVWRDYSPEEMNSDDLVVWGQYR